MILTFFIFLVEVSLGDTWYHKWNSGWNTGNERIREFKASDYATCKNACKQDKDCNAVNIGKKGSYLNKCQLFRLPKPPFGTNGWKTEPYQFNSDNYWDAFYVLRDDLTKGEKDMTKLYDDFRNYHQEDKKKDLTEYSCTVRLHRSSNCDNTDRYFLDKEGKKVNYSGDVLWQWTTTGKYKTFVWEQFAGWVREDDGPLEYYMYTRKLVDTFEDWTSAVSFTGHCAKIEIFDEDAWDQSFFDRHDTVWNTPGASTLSEYGVMPYEDNCVYDNHDIQTNINCHWACNNKNGCPGKTPNCIQLRSDLNDDIQGFYMRPWNGLEIGEEKEKRASRNEATKFVPNGVAKFGLFIVISAVMLGLMTLVRAILYRKVGNEEILD